uniref:non-specific serine/threonine protein kinase n=1 Tax=Culicoides sonorensis TaxID=179676 RepID=A0A336M6W9_CULSO
MFIRKTLLIIFIFIPLLLNNGNLIASERTEDCTELAKDEEPLLVFSTLGGGLVAVDPLSSEVRWQMEDEPAIKVPPTSAECPRPKFLPDPRDGSLYRLQGVSGLKKMPYTIPQLVASAPCKSSDGILYSGKKKDTWFLIDPVTGRREKVLGFGAPPEQTDSIGWATKRAIYLGRTQYTVLMYDSKGSDKKPWNVTFYDYASHSMAPELTNDYEYLHVSSSESGSIVTLDRKSGKFIWEKDFSTPVIAVFLLGREGLLSVPFTTVSELVLQEVSKFSKEGDIKNFDLFRTLYVGEHSSGLYALPSHTGKDEPVISIESNIKRIAGPHSQNEEDEQEKPSDYKKNIINLNEIIQNHKKLKEEIVVLGHYENPSVEEDHKLKIHPSPPVISDVATLAKSAPFLPFETGNGFIMTANAESDSENKNSIRTKTEDNRTNWNEIRNQKIIKTLYFRAKHWIDSQENKILKVFIIILCGCVISMLWYLHITVKELKQQSQTGSSSGRFGGGQVHQLEDLGSGEIRIGKITFSPNKVLGKGCEGTFVFQGTFEERQVAVKRLLPECFTLADREVSLLRESDAHENVVRYFCTEQDRQFRYIAVELCAATLQDYVEGPRAKQLKSQIDMLSALFQASSGLAHLHSLNIVHRDIKPQNVLLSLPDGSNKVRAMISDFGLCKKLNLGRTSFSRRSGVTGTEGWIAPEMIRGQRTTTSVDIFSMGCVYYYVLTNGSHAFGDVLKRQANILAHDYDLRVLNCTGPTHRDVLAEELIKDMIHRDPARRPPAKAILKHPLFWNEQKILAFLQDISDRIEKAELTSEPLRSLERNAKHVVRDDWSIHLDPEVEEDLKKFRGYQGISVRDLLRALRNKKHHYHELSYDVQQALGTVPTEFTRYWISKFPHLVSHCYHALQIVSEENIFKSYYHPDYLFTRHSYLMSHDYDNVKLISFYENNLKNASKSPKRVKNGGNQAQNQQDLKRSPYLPRKENQENKSPQNKRGMYNFKRYSPEENGLTEVPVFITRDQMGNFLTPPSIKIEEKNKLLELKQDTEVNKNEGEQKIIWKLPKNVSHSDDKTNTQQPKGNNKNKNKSDKKNRKKDE